ncbi:MAG: hypothetical protein LUM44_16980 [Pyrinomonadaceae bacterium]|nr:hypothetical protein [Pyrinomonadaceae bacterium]
MEKYGADFDLLSALRKTMNGSGEKIINRKPLQDYALSFKKNKTDCKKGRICSPFSFSRARCGG